ncbi:MAG: CHAP domain-containing protein [Actinobacteria bacterium]|nr:CHAP domain-containing protein [Actinomycetota bacterium]
MASILLDRAVGILDTAGSRWMRHTISLLALVLVVTLLASPSDSAAAAPRSTGGQHLSVDVRAPKLLPAAGHQHLIGVDARTSPSATCRAAVVVHGSRTMLTQLVADRRGRVSWEWLILRSSPSGDWRITVYCKLGGRRAHATTDVLIVTGSRHRGGAIGDPTSVRSKFGQPAGEGGGVCGPFEPGQCTCLAYQKRPDVYNTAVAHGVPAGGARAAGRGFYVWDGEQWLVNAQRAGIPTGRQPVAGALVVWGVPNSAAWGHVAYVEATTSPTHVLIAECNYDFQGHCRTIWENPQAASHLQGYIYGGPPATVLPRVAIRRLQAEAPDPRANRPVGFPTAPIKGPRSRSTRRPASRPPSPRDRATASTPTGRCPAAAGPARSGSTAARPAPPIEVAAIRLYPR